MKVIPYQVHHTSHPILINAVRVLWRFRVAHFVKRHTKTTKLLTRCVLFISVLFIVSSIFHNLKPDSYARASLVCFSDIEHTWTT